LIKSLEEHLVTHETFIETHEKLKEAHSFLLEQKNEPIEITRVGVTCDIFYESICALIFVATNSSCSTSKKG
jgi:hypothetical protein